MMSLYMGIRINTDVLKIPDRYGSIRDAAERENPGRR